MAKREQMLSEMLWCSPPRSDCPSSLPPLLLTQPSNPYTAWDDCPAAVASVSWPIITTVLMKGQFILHDKKKR